MLEGSMTGAASRVGVVAALMLSLAGCATTSFAPERLVTPDELRDVKSKTIGDVGVSVSMLTDAQARQHFGVDLSRHDLQALWISVRNGSDRRLWFIRNMLDPDFYSAEEAALLVQGDVPKDARQHLHQLLRDESIRAQLTPRTVTEGFMFLPRVEGGRYVDIRLQSDAYQEDNQVRDAVARAGTPAARSPRELRFDFALPLPDGDFDYERLDTSRIYGEHAPARPHRRRTAFDPGAVAVCAMDADGRAGRRSPELRDRR